MPDPYDLLTIAAVVDDMATTIGNGRIQRIGLVDARTIVAEVYANGQRHHLLASADDRLPRLRLAEQMPSLDTTLITPLGLLLRKYVRGGIILSIDQPPLERLARFSIAKRLARFANDHPSESDELIGQDDDGDLEEIADVDIRICHLYVELMGRHSNLILVDDDGMIMESAKRVTPSMSRVRIVLPRHVYLPPPPPDRLDPRTATTPEMAAIVANVPPDAEISRTLVTSYRGLSPTMAREIVFRALGPDADHGGVDVSASAGALAAETRQLLRPLETGKWQPQVYRDPDEDEVVAFSAVPMSHLAHRHRAEDAESISAAAALAEQGTQRPSPLRHAQRRQRLLNAVLEARGKVEHRQAALASQAARAAEGERFKRSGELIYAHLWEIAPGQTELHVEGLHIALDPRLSATDNAQDYFERYRKAQSAEAQLPQLSADSDTEMAYLDQLATLISQAPGFAELEQLAAEWTAHTAPPSVSSRPRRKSAPRRPAALVDAHGNNVLIGRSGPQNDLVTFDIAGPDDTWLHARGVGGSHVIIRWQNPAHPEEPETIEAAAALAAWYSAAREGGSVEVDVAPRRHVRKIKGAGPGMVTYRNERTIRVQPLPEESLRDRLTPR